VQDNLGRVINWYLLVDLNIVHAVERGFIVILSHRAVVHVITVLVNSHLGVDSHNNFMPINVNVSLHKGHGLG
jgi:hypothetical protein